MGKYIEALNMNRAHIILLAIIIMHFLIVLPYSNEGFPRGGDFFFNYFYLEKTTEFSSVFMGGNEVYLWNNYYNMGHPMFYYYQFLPYLIPAMIKQLIDVEILFLFKMILILGYTTLPLGWYYCMRSFCFREKYALIFAVIVAFIHTVPDYARIGSFTYLSFFQYGSYSFLFASVVFPFALGVTWKYIQDVKEEYFSKNLFLSILGVTLTTLSHVLLGFLLVFCIGIMFSISFIFNKIEKKKNLQKCCLFFLFFILTTSIVWFPALQNSEWYGGLDEAGEAYTKGFGMELIFDVLMGSLLDYGRIPILTTAFLLGFLLFLIPKSRKRICAAIFESEEKAKPATLFILFGTILSSMAAVGVMTKITNSVGIGVEQFFPIGKFLVLMIFFIVFFIVFCIAFLLTYFERITEKASKQKRVFMYFILFLLLLFLFYEGTETFLLQDNPGDFANTSSVLINIEDDVYLEEFSTFMINKEFGTIYVGNKTSKTNIQQIPEILSWKAKKPILFASSGGFHETPTTTYTWFYQEKMPIMIHMNNLFNVKYIVFVEGREEKIKENIEKTNEINITEKAEWYAKKYPLDIANNDDLVRLAFFNPVFVVYEQKTAGIFDVGQAPIFLDTSLEEKKLLIKKWMTTELPLKKEFLAFPFVDKEKEKGIFPYIITTNSAGVSEIFIQNNNTKEEQHNRIQDLWLRPVIGENNEKIIEDLYKENVCGAVIKKKKQIVGEGQYIIEFTKKEQPPGIESCFLILKVSAHPDWKATIKGKSKEEIKIYGVSPNFMGINLDDIEEGEYVVEFSFKVNKTREILLLLLVLTMLSLFIICHPKGMFLYQILEDRWGKE